MEALEALALGELDETRAREVEAHAADCASCKRELEWLRAERELMSRRAADQEPVPPELWRGIEARIAPPAQPQSHRWVWVGGAVAIAAAAALLLVWRQPRHEGPVVYRPDAGAPVGKHHKLDPKTALDNAEREYAQAISVMEAEVRKKRPDVKLEEWTTKVKKARELAGNDPEARLAVLDGYASYMHSLLDLEDRR
jgi:predicted anti-sigma-YlaC factor YlaD